MKKYEDAKAATANAKASKEACGAVLLSFRCVKSLSETKINNTMTSIRLFCAGNSIYSLDNVM